MWRILQQDTPDDYVLATEDAHSVQGFVEIAFAEAGDTMIWEGSGRDEVSRDAKSGQILVQIDPRYF
jgi:GDPmannose 4,6-dehydratase